MKETTLKSFYRFVESYLVKYLNKNSHNRNVILVFFDAYKNSDSIYILRILVLFLIQNYNNYKEQVLEIFEIIYKKNGFNGPDDKFQLYFRNLINTSFLKLPPETKNKIVEIILSIKRPAFTLYHTWQDKNIGRKRVEIYNYGRKQYSFICSLPYSEISKFVDLKKKHQEFKRKYGEMKHDSALDVSKGMGFYSVGPPIKAGSYEKLTLKNWKESMLKFDDSYQGRGAKGGKYQHKEEFKKRVEIEPNKYYNFLLDLVDTRGVSIDYFIAGIDGLMFANYDIKKLKILFMKLTKLDLDYWGTLNLIWKVKIFIDNNLFDDGILAFMIDSEKKYYKYENQILKEGKKHNNSNSIRGAICDNLICCNEYNKYENIIFEFIEESINNEMYDLGNILILKVAYLKAFDKRRSFSIFKKLVDTNDIELLKLSVNQSQYFNKDFHYEMIDYFKKIMNSSDLNIKGEVIVLSWLDDDINDFKLYQEYIESSDDAKLCAIRMAENHIEHEDEITRNRALNILFSFLNQKGEKFAQEYSGVVLRKYKKENFKKSLPFLRQYSVSNVCHECPYYFIELLLEVSKDYPNECLDLIGNINLHKIDRGFSNRDPTNVVLAIYSKLMKNGVEKEKKNIDKALDMFDSMLKHSHLRTGANKAIELTL